ncbi:uncharacterized protein LOC120163149 [Hibiscus syriacus]|uniref:uncharacterized protein LOC120163149 n=1 Tax=Hibiscus syriacus TaxID=106335 RepID=UPI0019231F11|nr:uncharacterized protein LOC120163149 [Hibiscus syriacus]
MDTLCPLCDKFSESVSHLFLYCEVVWGLWSRFLHFWNVSFVVPESLTALISVWIDLVPRSTIWTFILGAEMWNTAWFVYRFPDVKIPFDSLVGDPKVTDFEVSSKKSSSSLSHWVPPPSGFVKLNVDGDMVKGWSRGGIGGLLRDNDGVIFGSFSESVGPDPPIIAELLAIKRGLFLFVVSGFDSNGGLILESDCSTALQWIKNLGRCTPLFESMVKDIASLVVEQDVIVRHILRSVNWEANGLAKDGIG